DRIFLLKPIINERRAGVVGAAIVQIGVRHWQVLEHGGGNRVDTVSRNPVPGKRIANYGAINRSAGQKVVDNHWAPLSSQSRKVAGPFGCSRHDHADASCLYVVIVFSGKPKECLVLNDGTAETTTHEIVRIIGFRNTGFLAEEVVLLRPNRTRLKETGTMKGVGTGFERRVEHPPARAAHLGIV